MSAGEDVAGRGIQCEGNLHMYGPFAATFKAIVSLQTSFKHIEAV